ncbi:hypothetical protein LR48_Vigan04g132100 [Vigna angularis]|uniref:Uncharacterized protein n=1 Tax=Phaseolus angularis TaxID=3914 RepID=A0A0L9UEF6_PHAAN|nr:hypothetical protein LR48_Vigan04g132100 [Vigna angularis]
MASPSSSSRGKEKVARVTRNASPSGWISDQDMRTKFLHWTNIKKVVPNKYMDLQLFKKEGFLFQDWIAYQGLTDFLKMKGHCYQDLVEVFYTNLRVVNGVIHSRVKGVNITIDDNVWLDIARLKAEGFDSHIRDSESNRWLTKRAIYINCLTYPRSKVLELQGVYVFEEERRIVCKRSEEIGIPSLSSIGLKKTVNEWFFIDEQTIGSPPTLDQDHIEDSDDEDSLEF